MSLSFRAFGHAAGLWLVAAGALSLTTAAESKRTINLNRGQELFEHVWQPGADAAAGGDGLGPLFNERSCVACHNLGGIGGAGPNKNNVTILTAVPPEIVPNRGLFQARLNTLHPGFANGTSIVLHTFSTDPVAYGAFRDGLLGVDPAAAGNPFQQAATSRVIVRKESQGPIKTIEVDGTTLLLSQRNTTPLFGLSLIDSIPAAVMNAVAAIETTENPRVHGRFLGRFGWRGQLMTLTEFNRGACATELGLQVSSDAQNDDPVLATAEPPVEKKLDLTDRQCNELTGFVANLPAPRRLRPVGKREVAVVREGEKQFASVGCAVCHRPVLGNVKGIYSDLLVHAMGSRLSDPMPSPLSLTFDKPQAAVPSKYYGASPDVVVAPAVDMRTRKQEWKTPPLWGLRDSGPYLHDGRAETVEEAIACHGGEAIDSLDRYNALATDARTSLLAFLATLAAPDPAILPKSIATKDHPAAPIKPRKYRAAARVVDRS